MHTHQTGGRGLHCDEDGWFGGSFRPGRWREKNMRDAWQLHLAHAATGAVLVHGTAANVADKVCACVRCSIASRTEHAAKPIELKEIPK
jgi:hypothetical protein